MNRLEAAPNLDLGLTSSRGEEARDRSQQGGKVNHVLDPMARRAVGGEVGSHGTTCRFGVEALWLSATTVAVVGAMRMQKKSQVCVQFSILPQIISIIK